MARVTGVEALQARLAALPAQVREAARQANQKSAQEFVDKLHATVPHDTGDLDSTIRIIAGKTETGFGVAVGDAAHPYATAVEFGHMDHGHHVPPRPFFFPALRVLRKRFRSRCQRAANAAIKGLPQGGDDA